MSSNIKIYNEDCLQAMKGMADKQFDLAIVDPPYGINMAEWDKTIPTNEYWSELFRVSKNQIVFGGNYFNLPHTESWICWDKTFNDDVRDKKLTKGGCPRENMSDFELIWTSFKHKSKMLRFTQIGNLIGFGTNIKVDYKHEQKIHPTQKHIKIYEWLIEKFCVQGNLILDTHLGSGSIAIACYKAGYDLTAYEIDKDYYEAACKRLEEYKKQLTLW